MPSPRVRRAAGALSVVALWATSACSSGDDSAPPTTPVAPTTTTTPTRTDDGQLVVGVLLPTTGTGGNQLGPSMTNAIMQAADEINAAGGVLGNPVEVIEADEGSSVASAAAGFDELLTAGVDAIIGPASSIVALANLDIAVAAEVPVCSPTASALALDDYPDNGLFFRTVPSDSLQAVAIAEVVERTGAPTISLGYLDDAYGRSFAEAFKQTNADRNIELTAEVRIRSDDQDLTDDAADLLADGPGAIVLLGDPVEGTRMLAAIDEVVDGTAGPPPPIIVNDALRNQRSQQVISSLSDEVRGAIVGVAPVAEVTTEGAPPGPYAANAYDCMNLIALAAAQTGSDSPRRIASQIASVSVGGRPCGVGSTEQTPFADCIALLQNGLQINYQGPSGNSELSGRTGSPVRARFVLYRFSADGRDVSFDVFDVIAD